MEVVLHSVRMEQPSRRFCLFERIPVFKSALFGFYKHHCRL